MVMAQATLETIADIKYIPGPLQTAHSRVVPGTELHAHEVITLRKSKPNIRNLVVGTADLSMYRVEHDEASQGNEAFFYFAKSPHNLIFRDIKNAIKQLIQTGNYIPPKDGIEEVVAAAKTGQALRIKIEDLRLLKGNPDAEEGFFDIYPYSPNHTKSLSIAQRQLVESVYGKDIKSVSGSPLRVWVLDSPTVKKQLKGKEDMAVVRPSRLGRDDFGSWFFACDNYVELADIGLLGVLKEGVPKYTTR